MCPVHTSVTMVEVKMLWSYSQPSRQGTSSAPASLSCIREALGLEDNLLAMWWQPSNPDGTKEVLSSGESRHRCSGVAAVKFWTRLWLASNRTGKESRSTEKSWKGPMLPTTSRRSPKVRGGIGAPGQRDGRL